MFGFASRSSYSCSCSDGTGFRRDSLVFSSKARSADSEGPMLCTINCTTIILGGYSWRSIQIGYSASEQNMFWISDFLPASNTCTLISDRADRFHFLNNQDAWNEVLWEFKSLRDDVYNHLSYASVIIYVIPLIAYWIHLLSWVLSEW